MSTTTDEISPPDSTTNETPETTPTTNQTPETTPTTNETPETTPTTNQTPETTPTTNQTPETTPTTNQTPETTPTTPSSDPEPSTDISDQDTKSGKCTSNDVNCYLQGEYWQDMEAVAEGPLVNVINSLPSDLKQFFQKHKEVVVAQTEVSGLEWTKITDVEFDKTSYVELDDPELESEMVTAAQTTPDKIIFTQEKFNEITLEDELTDKTFVVLESGDMYLPKVTVSDKMSKDSFTSVENVMMFVGLSLLVVLIVVVFINNNFLRKPGRPKFQGFFNPSMMQKPPQYTYPMVRQQKRPIASA